MEMRGGEKGEMQKGWGGGGGSKGIEWAEEIEK